MIPGSCLCGAVRFEIERATGPFELCHCSRCRKASGSAYVAGVGVRRGHFRWVAGQELVTIYDAPVRKTPPAYRTSFCRRCGSPVPDPTSTAEWFEVAAGTLDADPGLRPDKHIFVDVKAPWGRIVDDLPQVDEQALAVQRARET